VKRKVEFDTADRYECKDVQLQQRVLDWLEFHHIEAI
jgi:hypothetical protein